LQDKNEDKNISKELTAPTGKYKLLDNVIVDSQAGNKPIKAPIFFIVQVQRSAFDPDAMPAESNGPPIDSIQGSDLKFATKSIDNQRRSGTEIRPLLATVARN